MFSIRSHRGFAVPISKRKLTVEQVLEARLRFASGEDDWSQLSRIYGVRRETIKSAVLGFTFKDLPMPPKKGGADQPFPYG
jgi:hypothetical protein